MSCPKKMNEPENTKLGMWLLQKICLNIRENESFFSRIERHWIKIKRSSSVCNRD